MDTKTDTDRDAMLAKDCSTHSYPFPYCLFRRITIVFENDFIESTDEMFSELIFSKTNKNYKNKVRNVCNR